MKNISESFTHQGFKDFYETGSKKGIRPDHAPKLARILDILDASINPEDMDLPGVTRKTLSEFVNEKSSLSV